MAASAASAHSWWRSGGEGAPAADALIGGLDDAGTVRALTLVGAHGPCGWDAARR